MTKDEILSKCDENVKEYFEKYNPLILSLSEFIIDNISRPKHYPSVVIGRSLLQEYQLFDNLCHEIFRRSDNAEYYLNGWTISKNTDLTIFGIKTDEELKNVKNIFRNPSCTTYLLIPNLTDKEKTIIKLKL